MNLSFPPASNLETRAPSTKNTAKRLSGNQHYKTICAGEISFHEPARKFEIPQTKDDYAVHHGSATGGVHKIPGTSAARRKACATTRRSGAATESRKLNVRRTCDPVRKFPRDKTVPSEVSSSLLPDYSVRGYNSIANSAGKFPG